VGNGNDLVGRFFMEHFEIMTAQVSLEKPHPFKLYTIPSTGKARARAEIKSRQGSGAARCVPLGAARSRL